MDVIGTLVPFLQLAGLYALISLAWVAVFQATGAFNLATGSFILLGPYFVVGLVAREIPLAVALLFGLVAATLVAVITYLLVLRPLAGRPILAPIIVTLGVSIALDAIVKIIFGSGSRPIADPGMFGEWDLGGGRSVPVLTLVSIAVAFGVVLTALGITRGTRLGILMRAASENPLRAGQLGIGIHRMAALGWAIGGLAAALAGTLFSLSNLVSPELSLLGLKGLAPAMLGGFQSQGGALIGSIALAAIETGAVRFWGGSVRDVVPFIVLLAILLIRPQGLFGKPAYLRV
jgi:branched-chain amino acid transport system permease protein